MHCFHLGASLVIFLIITSLVSNRCRVSCSKVVTIAGSGVYRDGSYEMARFNLPYESAIDLNGDIIISDQRNHCIRKIHVSTGTVTTIAGIGKMGYEDGYAFVARFNNPKGIVIDSNNDIIVADWGNHCIRKVITSKGIVTTVAGTGEGGNRDGHASISMFRNPSNIAIDSQSDILIVDERNNAIRKLHSSNAMITTLTGGTRGFKDGDLSVAMFNFPNGIAINQTSGDIIIADTENNRIRKISLSNGIVSTIAGGHIAGNNTELQLRMPMGVVMDQNGDIIITDATNDRICKISSSGELTTISGGGERGYRDGGLFFARFNLPKGLSIDSNGNIIVVDSNNHAIRKLLIFEGKVVTITGGNPIGSMDGPTSLANFHRPSGIAFDLNNNYIVVADRLHHAVRKVVISTGLVTTIAGNGNPGFRDGNATDAMFDNPSGVAVDSKGDIIVADFGNHIIRKISITNGIVSTIAGSGIRGFEDGSVYSAKFDGPISLDITPNGDVVVADEMNNAIRKIVVSNGTVITIAGGIEGFKDGHISLARFSLPRDVAIDPNGDIIVADWSNSRIRKIFVSNQTVVTVAGTGEIGFLDGNTSIALFNSPYSIAVNKNSGDIVVADVGNNRVRKISVSSEVVSTIAGSDNIGHEDGPSSYASFNRPIGVAFDINENIIISDVMNNIIRKIILEEGVTTKIIGLGYAGFQDGDVLISKFNSPSGISIDKNGDIFIADTKNHRIRKVITSSRMVHSIAGNGGDGGFMDGHISVAMFNSPMGVAIDNSGDIIIADQKNHRIRKILSSLNTVITIAGSKGGFQDGPLSTAKFSYPTDVSIDQNGDIIVADSGNHKIRKIINSSGVVTTIAGSGMPGFKDGNITESQFHRPCGVTVHRGNIYIADTLNNLIRMIDMQREVVLTVAGTGQGFQDGSLSTAKFYHPTRIAINPNRDIIIADSGNNRIRMIKSLTSHVDTIAGSGIPNFRDDVLTLTQFNNPFDIAIDSNGDILVADKNNHVIRKIVNFPCPVGRHTNTSFISSGKCTMCLPGTYSIERGAINCKSCNSGKFNPFLGHYQCYDCPPGTYSLEGETNCTHCPEGYFNFQEAQSSCSPCDAGYIAPNKGQTNCTACQKGYFNSRQGESICIPCSEGYFTSNEGQTQCEPCGAGTFSTGLGNSNCQSCNPGFFNPYDGHSKCLPCPKGNFSHEKGQDRCIPCDLGTYASEEGQASCIPCPRNFFSEKEGQTECKSCAYGFISEEGSKSCQFILNAHPFNIVVWVFIVLLAISISFVTVSCIVIIVSFSCKLRQIRRKHEEQLELKSYLLEDADAGDTIPFDIDISSFEIEAEELKELKEIGSGGSGSLVFKAKRGHRDVVVKLFRYSSIDISGMEQFTNELKFFTTLRDKNIVYFYGACMKPPRIGIVMEYCPNGTLKEYLKKKKLRFKQKLQLALEIADGMNFLHSNQVIHRDLKSENVLIDEDCHAKIADFGISKSLGKNQNTVRVGTGSYMAPEVTLGMSYDEKCDIFSFGIIMYEILTENFTPYGNDAYNIEYRVANNPTCRPIVPDDLHIDNMISTFIVLMTKCWSHEANARPSFYEIRNTLSNM